MAVWMNVFGKNGLGRYLPENVNKHLALINSVTINMTAILDGMIEAGYTKPHISYYKTHRKVTEENLQLKTDEEYRSYLNSIRTPYMKIDALIDHWIESGESRAKELAADFDVAYKQSLIENLTPKWKVVHADDTEAVFINDLGFLSGPYFGLRINLFSDIVCMTGPSCIMGNYWTFPSGISDNSRNNYHAFFKEMLGKFDSSFILYAHEWTGLYADDDRELTSEELVSRLEMDKNTSLHHMQANKETGWFYEVI